MSLKEMMTLASNVEAEQNEEWIRIPSWCNNRRIVRSQPVGYRLTRRDALKSRLTLGTKKLKASQQFVTMMKTATGIDIIHYVLQIRFMTYF